MSWRGFGPEWNPVLLVLAILAVLCVLAAIQWWIGLLAVAVLFFAAAIYALLGAP